MKKKKTMGAVSLELARSAADNTHSAHDQMLECLSDWDKSLFECAEDFKKRTPTDFYIVVITKKERLMPNVLRNYFTARFSCPTPDYDQTVYRFERKNDVIDFLWTIPSKDTCLQLKEHALAIHPEERQLLQFVLDFADGSLFELAKKLNGEEEHSPFLEK
jgi:hypothetical protein